MRAEGHLPMRIDENRFCWYARLAAPFGLLIMASFVACATRNIVYDNGLWDFSQPLISRVTNLSDSVCREDFSARLASALVKEGETVAVAKTMATDTLAALSYGHDARPFYAFSPADVRYGFFIQKTKAGCVIRLYERESPRGKGRSTYTNTWNYITTRSIENCSCGKNRGWPEEDWSGGSP